MNPADLARRGRTLYGPCWQTPLAEALGVRRETVVRWSNGSRGTPDDLGERLDRVAEARVDEIRAERGS